ncbi:MAG: hypothetical protein Q9214_002685 [Letrouitia sp. 1 TL-2023]
MESLAAGSKPDLVVAHLGIPREQVEKVLQTATKAGVDTIFNPSPATAAVFATCKNVTHLVLNEHEAAHLLGREYRELCIPAAWKTAAEEFIEPGIKNVVITLAEKGTYYATHDGKSDKVDAVQDVDVKNTTGAGDASIGMYAVEYLQQKQHGGLDIEKAIKHGCKSSAQKIERLGALESIPWIDEIDARDHGVIKLML